MPPSSAHPKWVQALGGQVPLLGRAASGIGARCRDAVPTAEPFGLPLRGERADRLPAVHDVPEMRVDGTLHHADNAAAVAVRDAHALEDCLVWYYLGGP